MSTLHQNKDIEQRYFAHLDSLLDPENIPADVDALCHQISSSIHEALDTICPKSVECKASEPWTNSELQDLMTQLRKDPKNASLKNQVREKCKVLNNLYYHQKAMEINCAAEARQVEKEFHLAKNYSMHKSSSKIDISKEKLTKHFKEHFSERVLELPPELATPENFDYLKDSLIAVNQEPPTLEEIKEASKSFKNNKSFGTDNVPPEGVKYSSSKHLFYI